jgi:hypothetical protein
MALGPATTTLSVGWDEIAEATAQSPGDVSEALQACPVAALDPRDGGPRKVWSAKFGLREAGSQPQVANPGANCRQRWTARCRVPAALLRCSPHVSQSTEPPSAVVFAHQRQRGRDTTKLMSSTFAPSIAELLVVLRQLV